MHETYQFQRSVPINTRLGPVQATEIDIIFAALRWPHLAFYPIDKESSYKCGCVPLALESWVN